MRRLGCGLGLLVCLVAGAAVALLIVAQGLPDAKQPAIHTAIVAPRATPLPSPGGLLLAVPVAGVDRSAIHDNWGDPRDNGLRAHHGTDIMAPGGTPVIAAAPGMVEKLFQSAAGGTTAYVRSPARRWTYYYAHLAGYAPGLHEGQIVKTGDPIGVVGDTGNAGAGNYHLHFGLMRTMPEQHWYEGQDVDPFPYLAGTAARR
jgi:murein DD-endopeptidase MepM/ murein hydrolase activator NlpD